MIFTHVDKYETHLLSKYIVCYTSIVTTCLYRRIKDYKIIFVDCSTSPPIEKHNILKQTERDILYTGNFEKFAGIEGVDIQLHDMLDAIGNFKLKDNDFVVKIDGECSISTFSPFFEKLAEVSSTNKYDCIIRYGRRNEESTKKSNICIEELIGNRVKYFKKLNDGKLPRKKGSNLIIVRTWSSITFPISNSKIAILPNLGILLDFSNNPHVPTNYITV